MSFDQYLKDRLLDPEFKREYDKAMEKAKAKKRVSLKPGGPHKFYGVDGNFLKLGPKVFEAIEDPSDGYRSFLEDVLEVTDPATLERLTFFKRPLDSVMVIAREENQYEDRGFTLVGRDGHGWLEIYTSYDDEYYPRCAFDYHPKVPPKAELKGDQAKRQRDLLLGALKRLLQEHHDFIVPTDGAWTEAHRVVDAVTKELGEIPTPFLRPRK